MSRRIDRDLFASLMRLSAGERTEILELLGESAVSPESVTPSVSTEWALACPVNREVPSSVTQRVPVTF